MHIQVDFTHTGKLLPYSLVLIDTHLPGADNGRVLGYDNAHGYHHRHHMGIVEPLEFKSYEDILDRFETEYRQYIDQRESPPGGKNPRRVESAEGFFSRMRANARRLDHGRALAPGVTLSFEDPTDFLEVITPARLRLLKVIGKEAMPLFALAAALSRDPSAVRRDVTLLETKHLLKTRKIPNPGHGTQTVVEKIAATITLAATV